MLKFKKNSLLFFLITAIFTFFLPQYLISGSNDLYTKKNAELRYFMLIKKYPVQDTLLIKNSNNISLKKKKPVYGILMSAVLPGTGEMYAGSWIKGALLLGAEALLWWKYFAYRDNGFDIEDEYKTFADAHWDITRWQENYNPDIDPSTHTLPDTKTQQYYEMIGKYDQFKGGWDDYMEGGEDLTYNRNKYMGMRLDSNDQFKKASTCAMLTLANHILSSIDAAWTIRKYNTQIKTQIRMTYKWNNGYNIPFLSLQCKW